jgi:hypothetical protein
MTVVEYRARGRGELVPAVPLEALVKMPDLAGFSLCLEAGDRVPVASGASDSFRPSEFFEFGDAFLFGIQ